MIMILFLFAGCFMACGPKPIAYITIDHPKAEEILIEDVGLFYAHQPAPKGAKVIEHLKEAAFDTDCAQAAMIALVQMQKTARQKGGNALINLKSIPGDEGPTSNDEGFWCIRKSSLEEGAGSLTTKVWEITWEGDIARITDELDVETEKDEEEGSILDL